MRLSGMAGGPQPGWPSAPSAPQHGSSFDEPPQGHGDGGNVNTSTLTQHVERLASFASRWTVVLRLKATDPSPSQYSFAAQAFVDLWRQGKLTRATLVCGLAAQRPRGLLGGSFFRTMDFVIDLVRSGKTYPALTDSDLELGAPDVNWLRLPAFTLSTDDRLLQQQQHHQQLLQAAGDGAVLGSAAGAAATPASNGNGATPALSSSPTGSAAAFPIGEPTACGAGTASAAPAGSASGSQSPHQRPSEPTRLPLLEVITREAVWELLRACKTWCFCYSYDGRADTIKLAMNVAPSTVMAQWEQGEINEWTPVVGLLQQKPTKLWVPPLCLVPLGYLLAMQATGRRYLPLFCTDLRACEEQGVQHLSTRHIEELEAELSALHVEECPRPPPGALHAGHSHGSGGLGRAPAATPGYSSSNSGPLADRGCSIGRAGAPNASTDGGAISPGVSHSGSSIAGMPQPALMSQGRYSGGPQGGPMPRRVVTDQRGAGIHPSLTGFLSFGGILQSTCLGLGLSGYESSLFQLFQGKQGEFAMGSSWWVLPPVPAGGGPQMNEQTRGPYSSEQMILACLTGQLEAGTRLCGTEPDVIPPLSPPPLCFQQLSDLLQFMSAGGVYELMQRNLIQDLAAATAAAAMGSYSGGTTPSMVSGNSPAQSAVQASRSVLSAGSTGSLSAAGGQGGGTGQLLPPSLTLPLGALQQHQQKQQMLAQQKGSGADGSGLGMHQVGDPPRLAALYGGPSGQQQQRGQMLQMAPGAGRSMAPGLSHQQQRSQQQQDLELAQLQVAAAAWHTGGLSGGLQVGVSPMGMASRLGVMGMGGMGGAMQQVYPGMGAQSLLGQGQGGLLGGSLLQSYDDSAAYLPGQ